MKIKKTESGQVIMLLTIGLVSLLAFAGLAIDGGRYYAEKRAIQNVADTTAFTGAKRLSIYTAENIDSNKMDEAEEVALNRAVYNGYDDSAADVTVTVDIAKEASPSPYYLVTVEITSEVDPTFIKIVHNAPLPVSAKAVARVKPKINVGFGYAMFSTSLSECDAFMFSGNSDAEINGSGIFSNSNCSCSILFSGSTAVAVEGDISTAGEICVDGAAATYSSAGENENVPQLPVPTVDPPECGSVWPAPSQYWVGSELHLLPGNYSSWFIKMGDHIVLDDGLYCIHGSVKITNGLLEGDHVMIYLINDGFTMTGGDLNLSAGQDGEVVDAAGTVWDGYLIFMDPANDQLIAIQGNGSSIAVGTIWAPDPPYNLNKAKCTFVGSGDMVGVNLQWICYSISLMGNSDMVIYFDENQQADFPVTLDLYE